MGEEHNLAIGAPSVEIGLHLTLVLLQVIGEDAHHGVLVDDGALCRHHTVLEEEMGAEAVHVAHKDLLDSCVVDVQLYAFAHAAGGSVGEGEAEHGVVVHALGMGVAHALGQYLGLATSRRGQNEVPSSHHSNDLLLALVGLPGVLRSVVHVLGVY